MTGLNDSQYVETMLDERRVSPRDLEMADHRAAIRAVAARTPRREGGLLVRLRNFIGAVSRRAPRAKRIGG